jgi:hypothetical protein
MVVLLALGSLVAATTVEQRPSNGGFFEVRATAETDLAPEHLADAFWNVRGKTIDAVKKRVVLKHDDKEHLVYQQLAMPIVKDRDYTIRIERYADPANELYQFTSRCDSAAGPDENAAHVRVRDCRGLLTIERLPTGRTLITYVAFANPAGSVPPFIVNMFAPNATKDVVDGLLAEARARSRIALKP